MAGDVGGRIKRIKIQNFMTYDHVEIYPKKGLNLIIGLNGTGKSSIMCAICLGLAGKPQFTGRATQLSDFIKHGCHEAEIEIELEAKKNNNVVICRKIKGEKCEWYINKSSSNLNEVASTVKKFNIDTSNLCQFLPQEKVIEFSRMDKKQRLENMLQAIGEPHLFVLFNELKDLHKKVTEIEQSVKKCHMNKNSAEEENVRISDEVHKQENRTRLKEELEELQKKKKVLIYQQIYEEVQILKAKEKSLAEDLEALRKEREEASNQENAIYNSYLQCSTKLQNFKSDRKVLMNKLTNKSTVLTRQHEQVENINIEYRNKVKEKEKEKKMIHDANMIVDGLKRQLADEIKKCPNYNEADQLNLQVLTTLQSEISELYKKMERLSTEKNQVEYCIKQQRSQMTSLQDEQNKKMENLKRRDKYTYEATCWLLKNRNRFKSNVFLPIMLEIGINNSDYTKYVENVIGFKDMIAFVCEDKSDCEMLSEILKKQMKLPVNIVMAPDNPLSNYILPPLAPEYRQCGLECFVVDLFTAPEPIMTYLCHCYGIHRIAVTKSVINSKHIEFILQKYPLFFSENMRISGKRSRYGERNLSIKKDFIVAQNLLVNHNEELLQEVQAKLQELEGQLERKNRKLEEYSALVSEKEKIQDKYRQEKKALLEQKRTIENLKINLIQKRKYLNQKPVVFDEEEEKRKMTKKIQSINENRQRVIFELNSLIQDFIELEKEIVKVVLSMNSFSKNLRLTKSSNEDIHEKVKEAETELQTISQHHRTKRHEGRKLLNDIQSEMNDNQYVKYLEDPKLHPVTFTMDDLEQRINHVQAELNLNEDNAPVIAEYNARKRKIAKIQEQINSFEQNLSEFKEILQEKKEEWLQPLQRHISNINKKFSSYFKQLSCAGEISLEIPENPDDFTKYGLQIKLKFHDDVPFIELSQTHHSGGECSVAAIVFILSLQELTEVPFRCIDEINQGMDSVNERKIYQLIADSVGEDRCSQYFLLTPKLLDGLEYPDDVAVHIIFNSCFLNIKLDVKKHIEIAQST